MVDERKASEKGENKGSNKGIIVLVVIFLVIVGLIILITVIDSNLTGNAINILPKNCKDVQVPYEEQEEYLKTEYYTETVPYEEQVPLKYDSSKSTVYNCGSLFDYIACFKVGIYNLDTIGDIFYVNCKIQTLNRELSDSEQGYVKPGEWTYFECKANTDLGEDTKLIYDVTPPTKSVTKYKDVQRERKVTAYRPVTKYRTEQQCN